MNKFPKKLKILYQIPSLETIYAFRTIYYGFKNAFEDLGYKFITLTSKDNLKEVLKRENPDILIASSSNYYLKFLDLNLIKKYRKKGMVMFTKIDYWHSPMKRLNEARSLKNEKKKIQMIKNGLLGDIFFYQTEQDDKRMEGFEKETTKKFETILLAADKILMSNENDSKFKADISYIGTNIPEKRIFFKKFLFPLGRKYNLKMYGQDWILKDRLLGWVQRFGQYFNINFLKKVQKPKLELVDESKIYNSSKICVNIHDIYQVRYGDINERFFKIMACKAFQMAPYMPVIKRYFNSKEVVLAKSESEWFNKINYYMNYPEKRREIAKRGYKKVMKYHTYHNRVKQIINLYKKFKENNK
jgi:spore maturation protein CgeB